MFSTKINTIKFLMNMFESGYMNTDKVSLFKNNMNEMCRRGQISIEVMNIIYDIYGIQNTDVYKESVQSEKLFRLHFIMNDIDLNNIVTASLEEQKRYKEFIDEMCKKNEITKVVKDLLYRIYDFDTLEKYREPLVGKINTVVRSGKVDPTVVPKTNIKREAAVLKDIEMFNSNFLDEICYVYENPSYDGCSGSSKYIHTMLKDAIRKPAGSVLKRYAVIYDDGCHIRKGYTDIPSSYYRSTKKTTSAPTVKTPKTVSSVSSGCDSFIPPRTTC